MTKDSVESWDFQLLVTHTSLNKELCEDTFQIVMYKYWLKKNPNLESRAYQKNTEVSPNSV